MLKVVSDTGQSLSKGGWEQATTSSRCPRTRPPHFNREITVYQQKRGAATGIGPQNLSRFAPAAIPSNAANGRPSASSVLRPLRAQPPHESRPCIEVFLARLFRPVTRFVVFFAMLPVLKFCSSRTSFFDVRGQICPVV